MKLLECCKKYYIAALHGYYDLSASSTRNNVAVLGGWLGAVGVYCLIFMSVASWWFILSAPLLIVSLFIALGYCANFLHKRSPLTALPERSPLREAVLFPPLICLIYLVLFFTLGLVESPDTLWQWEQVKSGKFDDWHPVVHTYTLYLLAQIWENNYFVAGCFVGIFSIFCSWFYFTLRQYAVRLRIAFILTLVVAFFPINIYALRVLWKDTAFMITVFAVGIAMVHLYFTRGTWLTKWYNQIFLAFLLVYASFVRHNGIFFTFTFVILLPLVADIWKVRWKLIVFSTIVMMLCGGYIFCRMEMIKHNVITQYGKDQSFHEAVGIPMSIMTYVFMNAPEKLSPEVIKFMTAVMPREKWKEYYKGDFNSVKFNTTDNLIGETTPKEFAKLFISTVKAAPGESVHEFLQATALGWEPWLRTWGLKMRFLPISWLGAPGFYVMVLLLLTLWLLPCDGIRVFFMSLPFAAYNYGTALMLMGNDYRFFWSVIVGSIPVITAMLIAMRHGDCGHEQADKTSNKSIKQ